MSVESASEGRRAADASNYTTAKMVVTPALSESTREKRALTLPIILCSFVSFGGFIFGWDLGTIGGITTMESFNQNFGTLVNPFTGERRLPAPIIGLIISIFNISCAIGGLTLAKVGDYKGRKFGVYVALIVYCVGLVIALMNDTNWIQFLFGRIFEGLGVGSTAVLVPIYLSEIAPLRIRGTMVGSYQLLITLGILTGNAADYGSHRLYNNDLNNMSWQFPISLGFVWALMISLGLMFTPESAPFLISRKNAIEEAKESFAKMNAISKSDHRTIDFIARSVRERHERKSKAKNQDIFEWATGKPMLGIRLLIGILVMSFQQLSGINYFFYYGTTIFERTTMDPYGVTMILSGVNFAATFGGLYTVEAFGRRACLLAGSIGMFCCMLIFASVGNFAMDSNAAYAVMITVTCVYLIFFATTLGPVTFALVSELFPMRTKATSMAVCTSFNWMFNFLISFLTPIMAARIGFLYGYFFAACLLVSAIFVWFMVPETKNMTETDIDALYYKMY